MNPASLKCIPSPGTVLSKVSMGTVTLSESVSDIMIGGKCAPN